MVGSVSRLSYYPPALFHTKNIQNTAPTQSERVTLPVQPVPAAREVLSNHDKFSVESLLQQYDSDPVGMAARMRIQFPDAQSADATETSEIQSAQEVFEEAECQTCSERKYQDGSDDPGVSFKTATHLSPEEAAVAVRGHEMEHVTRNQAKAQREDREIVSQSVTIHTDICPECGRVYTSGGTTRTVTRGDSSENTQQENQPQPPSFSAVA